MSNIPQATSSVNIPGALKYNTDGNFSNEFQTLPPWAQADLFINTICGDGNVSVSMINKINPKFKPQFFICNLRERWATIETMNKQGYQVWFTINETDTINPKEKDITKVRSFFIDLDESPLEPVLEYRLRPHAVVETSPGKHHVYFKVSDCDLKSHKAIQISLAEKFGGDTSVTDLRRNGRIPGTFNPKPEYGPDFPMTKLIDCRPGASPYTVAQLCDAFQLNIHQRRAKREEIRGQKINNGSDASETPEKDGVKVSETDKGSRNTRLFKAGVNIRNKNREDAHQEELVRVKLAAMNCSFSPPLDGEEFDRTIANVMKAELRDKPDMNRNLADLLDNMNLRYSKDANNDIWVQYHSSDGSSRSLPYDAEELHQFIRRAYYSKHGPYFPPRDLINNLLVTKGYDAPKTLISYRAAFSKADNAYYIDRQISPDQFIVVKAWGENGGISFTDALPSDIIFDIRGCSKPLPKPDLAGESLDLLDLFPPSFREAHTFDVKGEPSTQKLPYCMIVSVWAALVYCVDINRPGLMMTGDAGSGKTTGLKITREIIDPQDDNAQDPPDNTDQLYMNSFQDLLVSYDNVKDLEHVDTLCRIATGCMRNMRQFFQQRRILNCKIRGPFIINGSSDMTLRSDIFERCLYLQLESLNYETSSWTELKHAEVFNEAHPRILGALLTALSKTMKDIDEGEGDRIVTHTRFPDWEKRALLCATHLGHSVEQFREALNQIIIAASDELIFNQPILRTVVGLLKSVDVRKRTNNFWSNRELLEAVKKFAHESGDHVELKNVTSNAITKALGNYQRDLKKKGVFAKRVEGPIRGWWLELVESD